MKNQATITPLSYEDDDAFAHFLNGIDSILLPAINRRTQGVTAREAHLVRRNVEAFSLLPEQPRVDAMAHPLFVWWFVQTLQQDVPNVDWLLQLGRFTCGAGLSVMTNKRPVVTTTNDAGEIRLAPRYGAICLGTDQLRKRVFLLSSRDHLTIRGFGLSRRIAISALEETNSITGAPVLVRPRNILQGSAIEVDGSDPLIVEYLLSNARNLPVPEYGTECIRAATAEPPFLRALENALGLLKANALDFYDELLRYIKLIVPFSARMITNFSDKQLFGAVFLATTDRTAESASIILERLVHEAGHHRLNLIQSVAKLHRSPAELLLKSPLRRDARPVDGVFHATFVLTRVALVLSRIPSTKTRAREVAHNAQRGIDELNARALLTNAGAELLAEAHGLVSSIISGREQ